MSLPTRRIVVLRTSRDTLVLIACTVCATLALAYAVRQRPAPATVSSPARQEWVGKLADLGAEPAPAAQAEPMTSASLVVPKATLVLPQPPASPASLASRAAKPLPCDPQPCKAATPLPPARQKLAAVDRGASPSDALAPVIPAAKSRDRRFGLSDLNPIPHLPEAVRKPFGYAGAKISGWIDWF